MSDFLLGSPVDGIPLGVTDPFNAWRSYANKLHEGIDLRAVDDSWQPVPIVAPAPGIIVWASDRRRSDGQKSDYGNHIILDHENGFVTWYAHLSVMTARPGERVVTGDMLGIAGDSGRSDGIHLHLTLQHIGHGLRGYVVDWVVDPAPYLGL